MTTITICCQMKDKALLPALSNHIYPAVYYYYCFCIVVWSLFLSLPPFQPLPLCCVRFIKLWMALNRWQPKTYDKEEIVALTIKLYFQSICTFLEFNLSAAQKSNSHCLLNGFWAGIDAYIIRFKWKLWLPIIHTN